MAVPLRQKASDEPERNRNARGELRWNAAWHSGAISAAETRAAVAAFLVRVRETGGALVSDRVIQDAQLVVSELITNVVRHAPGACGLSVEVRPDQGRLLIGVWDASPLPPRPRPRDAHRIGGHGLEIVGALSDVMTVTNRHPGKEISVRMSLLAADASPAAVGHAEREPRREGARDEHDGQAQGTAQGA
ncbi:ATP-binding protein [Streptomyces sp. NPDC046985]|uniref:ATP-binding protein n=1 Tax=Streptomyces sp. NPDC046985 TaxID=3155377 RepID=UPI0033CE73F9